MPEIKAITFDFWGTLVDVDTSGQDGMQKVLLALDLRQLDARQLYLDWDFATVRRYRSNVWRPYFEWGLMGLKDVLQSKAPELSEERWRELAEMLMSTMTSQAKPHAEVPNVIAALKARYPLLPITNMDNRLFDMNPFRSEFSKVLTAEEARAFKPSALIFLRAIDRLGVPAENILHVSLAQFADLEGAMPVGINVAWINRGGEQLGRFTPKPLYEFADLSGLLTAADLDL